MVAPRTKMGEEKVFRRAFGRTYTIEQRGVVIGGVERSSSVWLHLDQWVRLGGYKGARECGCKEFV